MTLKTHANKYIASYPLKHIYDAHDLRIPPNMLQVNFKISCGADPYLSRR